MNVNCIHIPLNRMLLAVCMVMFIGTLAGCKNSELMPNLNLKKINLESLNLKPLLGGNKDEYIAEDENAPDGYYGYLYREYMALSQYESLQNKRKNDAQFYKSRAEKTKQETPILPLEVKLKSLPEHSRHEIAFARERLISVFKNLDITRATPLHALAQTRYDCWLRHSLIFPQEDALIACKDQFYTAMRILDKNSLRTLSASIYFDTNSIALNKDAKKQVGTVANTYRNMEPWHIILKGFTDSAGSKTKNKTLSMRRAVAVKNALGQHGFDLNHITILAAGEATQNEQSEKGTRDPKSRRVDIYLEPLFQDINSEDDSPQVGTLPGWSHGQ